MEKLLSRLDELYPLSGKYEYSEGVTKGFLSTNHIVANGATRFFLKQYRFTLPEKIAEIHAVKKYFSDKGIPVVLPLQNTEGASFFSYDGKFLALFPFVNDRHLEKGELSEKALRSLAEMLARLHQAGTSSPLIVEDEVIHKQYNLTQKIVEAKRILELVKAIEDKTKFDQLAQRSLEVKIELMEKNTLNYSDLSLKNDLLLHGDYHDQNVFFNDADEVSWVFDFEKTCLGPRMHEIIRTMDYSSINGIFTQENIDRAKLFLRAYHEVNPLSENELKDGLTLYWMKTLQNIWVETEHYLNNNSRVDQFLGSYLGKIEFFRDNMEKFRKELAEVITD